MRQRLVAILVADAVGYSRLMSIDGDATVAALDAARLIFLLAIEKEGGRVIDMAGDSVLAVFETAGGAVTAALAIQATIAAAAADVPPDRQLRYRIGVHLGDVMQKDDGTVYGDGINIAARLQSLADADGIVVSQSVKTAIEGRVKVHFADRGEQRVKNIAQPIHIFELVELHRAAERLGPMGRARALWRRRRGSFVIAATLVVVAVAGATWRARHPAGIDPATAAGSGGTGPVRSLGEHSIAVLPFANLSDDRANDAFAQGIGEELTSTLGIVRGLKVIAQASALQFKGKSVSMPEIGRQLGVAFLVEGSVRQATGRVRIAARLARAADGVTIWSESYDRALADTLDVQTEMALVITQRLQLQINREELAASRASNAEAERLYFEGMQGIYEHTAASYERARLAFRRALELDPTYALATVGQVHLDNLALAHRGENTFRNRQSPELQKLIATMQGVIAASPNVGEAYGELGLLQMNGWEFEAAESSLRRARELSPNYVSALNYLALVFELTGRIDEAIEARRVISELDPLSYWRAMRRAELLQRVGRPASALPLMDQAIALAGDHKASLKFEKAVILADLGRKAEALALLQPALAMPTPEPVIWGPLVHAGGRKEREWTEAYLRGLGTRNDIDAESAHGLRVAPLLALGRPQEALKEMGDENDFDFDTLGVFILDRDWDPVRDTPRFRTMLATLGATGFQERARQWRAANPPQRG